LEQAITLAPEHLSCYQLTIEPHTKLATRHATSPYKLPDDETALAFFHHTRKHLARAGYKTYEISNFAKLDKHCRHNDGYWLYHDYIGIGAGASGKWDCSEGATYRYSNVRSPEKYMAQISKQHQAINSDETLNLQQAAAEAIWIGLRRSHGIDNTWFSQRFGKSITEMFRDELEPWIQGDKLRWQQNHLQLTESGVCLADAVAESVL
jgi:oxygen-independent coproporphyrinogen-3 oxidase